MTVIRNPRHPITDAQRVAKSISSLQESATHIQPGVRVLMAADVSSPTASATPGADRIVRADGFGKIAAGWLPTTGSPPTVHGSTHVIGGSDAIPAATTSVGGLLSAGDKTKLDQFIPTTAKTLTVQNSLTLAGTDGKSATFTGSLTIGADTTISGGGTVALDGFALTVPATGTAALLGVPNTFSQPIEISAATGNTLIVDTNVLVVDATNNRVGIGSSGPLAKLQVKGTADEKQLIVQSNATQTANPTEWQSSGGGVLAAIAPTGGASFGTTVNTERFVNVSTSETTISPAGDTSGLYVAKSINVASNSTQNRIGIHGQVNTLSASVGNIPGLIGVSFDAIGFNTAGTITNLIGARARAFLNAATPVTNLYGVQTFTSVGTGTVTTAYGIDVGALTVTSGALTTGYGVYIHNGSKGAGTFTNLYGLYVENQTVGGTLNYAIYTNTGLVHFGDTTDWADGKNLTFGTSSGTKIGTATSQKLGLWNAPPVVQPTTAIPAATFTANTSGIVNDTATFDGYTIGQIAKALRTIGALA